MKQLVIGDLITPLSIFVLYTIICQITIGTLKINLILFFPGYDINIQVNRPEAHSYGAGAAFNPYSSPAPQGSQYGYQDNSYPPYGHFNSYTQSPSAYPPYGYYDPQQQAYGYYPQPNTYSNYPPNNNVGYYESQSYNHPQHSGSSSHLGNFPNQHQTGNRQSGNSGRENYNRNRDFRGGRGRGGVNKIYRSGNQKKKYNKKETDSDSDSSSSSDSSESKD